MTDEERKALIEKVMDLCAKLRDEEHPESWGLIYEEGFIAGCDNCLTLIHNELMYPKER